MAVYQLRVQTSNLTFRDQMYSSSSISNNVTSETNIHTGQYLFVLRFYGPVNPMGSCRAQSVYLATCLLGRLSPLGG